MGQDETSRNTDDLLPEDISSVFESIVDASTPPPSSNVKIHRVPRSMTTREKDEYDKYYVPKVVSIGPYHFGNPKLGLLEKLKPVFANKLLSNKEKLESLCTKLSEPKMVQESRDSYEKNSTNHFSDKVFTRMMLLDACFILYYIQSLSDGKHKDCHLELTSHQIVFIHQDLFLLENQIPFKVLKEVMNVIKPNDGYLEIKMFINDNILASGLPKSRWYKELISAQKDQSCSEESKDGEKAVSESEKAVNEYDHLLHLLHHSLTKNTKLPNEYSTSKPTNNRHTFRNVSELADVGIKFKPSGSKSLARIEFHESRWWCFSAKVELPPISVDDSTKPMLLNLVAYEMCSNNGHASWVTSYICLLDNLIDYPEDVRTLRKAGVLENSLGSDQEVAKLFNEIGTDLVPNNLAYLKAKNRIQSHYESWRNTVFSQLKHEYVKSPWAFLALVGALMALGLSCVQTYFSVWSPKSQCDDLCMLLKKNHHL